MRNPMDPISLTLILIFTNAVCLYILITGRVKPRGALDPYYRDENPVKYWIYAGCSIFGAAMMWLIAYEHFSNPQWRHRVYEIFFSGLWR